MSFSDSDDSDSNTTKLSQEEIDANRKLVNPNIDIHFERDVMGRHKYDRHRRSISRFTDMTEPPEPHFATNPIVYFDISVGQEYAGRMIFELRKDIVPKAAENFRALCTGEKGVGKRGMPLHYKGTIMYKIIRTFGCQGGDVVHNDGTGGESIYGPLFENENFTLKHEEGTLSLINYGIPDTNNSQFLITSNPCYNLDGRNEVFGHVLRGLSVIYNDMERVAEMDSKPEEQIRIEDSGQLMPGEDWGIEDNDETEDFLPQHPRDWDKKYIIYSVDEMVKLLTGIRLAGNYFFGKEKFYDARRKYRKAHRYYNFLRLRGEWKEYPQLKLNEEDFKQLDEFIVLNYNNMAAVELKLQNLDGARDACTEAIFLKKDCHKAYYRRAKVHVGCKDYDGAIEDIGMAILLDPGNKLFKNELNRLKRLRRVHNLEEARKYSKLFK